MDNEMEEKNQGPAHEIIPLEDCVRLGRLAGDALRRGDEEEFRRIHARIPVSPRTIVGICAMRGKKYVLEAGFNLSRAHAELEPGWLDKYDSVLKMPGFDEIMEHIEDFAAEQSHGEKWPSL